ncbi:hypothetical protein [Pseudomonas sp.]|nr:hypothetical protein [Pseudomonas sp.]
MCNLTALAITLQSPHVARTWPTRLMLVSQGYKTAEAVVLSTG